jgi:hypothetical protein
MWKTLTMLQLWPYLLGALLLAGTGTYVKGRIDGYAKSEREHQAAGVEGLIQAVRNVAAIGEAIAEIGRQLRAQLAESGAHESKSVATVAEVLRVNPEFAAVRRPADLQRVRDEQLERIRRATETD